MYTNQLKSLPVYTVFPFIERRFDINGKFKDNYGPYTKVEHFLFTTKSGVVIDIQPEFGIARKIIYSSFSSVGDNCYPTIAYSGLGNKLIVYSGDGNKNSPTITVYDPETGEIEDIEMVDKVGKYGITTGGYLPLYRSISTTTESILGSNFRFGAGPSFWSYNTKEKKFDFYKADSLPSFTAAHLPSLCTAIYIDTTLTSLNGYYHNYWLDKDGNNIFEIVREEALKNNIKLKGSNKFYIHDLDRDLNSLKRRVIGSMTRENEISPYFYIIDLKNPTTFLRTTDNGMLPNPGVDIYSGINSWNKWKDEKWADVSTKLCLKGSLTNEPFKSNTTVIKPSYSAGYIYSNSRIIGRFGYSSGYTANKVYTFTLPVSLEDKNGYKKGDLICPINWTPTDMSKSFYNNGASIHTFKCNFKGLFGFSNEDEYVGFFYSNDTKKIGFITPDTYEFIEYDPYLLLNNTDKGGYIISGALDTSIEELGYVFNDSNSILSTIEIDGEEYYADQSLRFMKSALKKDTDLNIHILQKTGDISFTVIPDRFKSHQKYNLGISNIPTTNGKLLNVTEMGQDRLLLAGITYSGVLLKERNPQNDILKHIYGWNSAVSYRGSLKISDNKMLYYGYMSRMDLIDITDYQNLNQSSMSAITVNSVIPAISYASKYTDDVVFISGYAARTVSYIGDYGGFGYTNLKTNTSQTFPNIPKEFERGSGYKIRTDSKLIASSYTDQETEKLFGEFLLKNKITRDSGIAQFLNTVAWSSQGIEPYNDDSGKFIISLSYEGISALTGIRINQYSDGTGVWYTSSPKNTIYPSAIFVHKSDKNLDALQESDYKVVKFVDLPYKAHCGRLCITDNYIVYLDIDNIKSIAIIRIISKDNFELAANKSGIAVFDKTITIPLSSTSTKYGFGSQGGDYSFFSQNGTPRNSYFNVGDSIFVTISSDTPVQTSPHYAAVVKIDILKGTYTNWCVDTVREAARGITYNKETDTAFVTRDFTVFRVPSFSNLSTIPYILK